MADSHRIMLLLSIIGRGKSRALMDMLDKKGITFHLQSVGAGTAPSEMMDILGLASNDKDILFSFAPRRAVLGLAAELNKDVSGGSNLGGLMMLLPLSAMNRLAAEVIGRSADELPDKGEENMVKSEYKHNLILISVNHGFTEQVMQTAKKAGATGGTVIRARQAEAGDLEKMTGIREQEEKEIVTILAPESVCGQIMSDVNREFGLKTEANGVVIALPVEKAFKI